jgi:hypothetical protein
MKVNFLSSEKLFHQNKKPAFIILILLISALTACATPDVINPYDNKNLTNPNIPVYNYASCVKAGNRITRSYPPQCIAQDGKIYISQEVQKLPNLNSKSNCKNLCGDGTCQEMVCMAIGCPCAESRTNCPQDCN